jgi:hypothetical protein
MHVRYTQGRGKQTYTQIYAHSMKNLIYIEVRVRDEYTEIIIVSSREDVNEISGFASRGNS